MAFPTFFDFSFFVLLEAARAQSHPMIQLDVRTDTAGFTDHYASSVINKKMAADFRSGMNVDSRPAMGPFGHNARNQGQPVAVEDMSQTLNGNRFNARITDYDLVITRRCGVSLVRGFDIGL